MTDKRKTIAIDVDDVLASSVEGFVNFMNDRWGTHLAPEDYTERWAIMWQVDEEEERRRAHEIHKSGVVATFEHFPDAEKVLRRLAQSYRLVVLTSRVKHLKRDTEDWIGRHFGGIFDEIHFAGFYDDLNKDSHKHTKAQLCSEIGADYLIDDHPKHCVAAAKAGIPTLLFGSYAWNREVKPQKNMVRVKDWQGVQEFFDAEIKR